MANRGMDAGDMAEAYEGGVEQALLKRGTRPNGIAAGDRLRLAWYATGYLVGACSTYADHELPAVLKLDNGDEINIADARQDAVRILCTLGKGPEDDCYPVYPEETGDDLVYLDWEPKPEAGQ